MIAWLFDQSGPWFINYFTLLLCGIASIFLKSRLLFSLFVYIAIWELSHHLLDAYHLNYIFPAVIVGMGIDVAFLSALGKLKIDCIVAPCAILAGVTYAGLHAIFSLFEVYVFRDLYPWVMTVTALVAVMEGLLDGFNNGGRKFGSFDRARFVIPWTSNNHKSGKET